MALDVARAHDTIAADPSVKEPRLLDELLSLEYEVLDGRHPRFKLPPVALAQLRSSLANVKSNADNYQRNADQVFSATVGTGVRAEGYSRRHRIEQELQDQAVKRKSYAVRERDAQTGELDVDEIYAQAQIIVVPVSGLKPDLPPSPKSSFDENDYYSSQVESAWSPDLAANDAPPLQPKAFTADFEQFPMSPPPANEASRKRQKLSRPPGNASHEGTNYVTALPEGVSLVPRGVDNEDADDEYIPVEPSSNDRIVDADESDDYTPSRDDSEYEPGAVSQESVPGAFGAAASPPIPVVRNHLTHLAAPQANRVSPLATQKGPGYELQLVNGQPEMVKVARTRYVTSQARLSSASPPATGNTKISKKKGKKRKREAEPAPKVKKRRDRQMSLDMSNQIPPHVYAKEEPFSPAAPVVQRSQSTRYLPHQTYPPSISQHSQPAFPPGQPSAIRNYEPFPSTQQRLEPLRASSTVLQAPVQQATQDLRRYASLQYAQGHTMLEQRPQSSAAYQPIHAGTHEASVPVRYIDTRTPGGELVLDRAAAASRMSMAPPHMPPRATKRVVVDQFGNRYVETGPAPDIRPVPPPEDTYERTFHARAPSRMSTSHGPSPTEQYDPANAHFEIAQVQTRKATAPSYPVEYIDGRRYRVREYVDNTANYPSGNAVPTSPDFRPVSRAAVPLLPPAGLQVYEPMGPPQSKEYTPQFVPLSSQQPEVNPAYSLPRAYSVQPDFSQPAPLTYAPRQGSVAPVQYIRQEPAARPMSVAPVPAQAVPYGADPQALYVDLPSGTRYIETRELEGQPAYMRSVNEFRQY